MKLNKAQMHQRPTYETLVKDTILEPKDKIALPDRQATILRKTQQLSRYDDAEFLDLEKDNEKIKQEQAQQAAINTEAGNDTSGSIAEKRATQPGPHQGHKFTQPPSAQPPSGGMPRSRMGGGQGQIPHAPAQTLASSSGPPPAPTVGPKVMAGRAAAKAPDVFNKQFDLTIDDDMKDAGNGSGQAMADHQQKVLEKKIAVANEAAQNLGEGHNQAYVARLIDLATRGRQRMASEVRMETSNNGQPPPPPPGVSGGKAIKKAVGKIPARTPIKVGARGRSPAKVQPDPLLVQPAGPPPVPAGMIEPAPSQPPGSSGPGLKKESRRDN